MIYIKIIKKKRYEITVACQLDPSLKYKHEGQIFAINKGKLVNVIIFKNKINIVMSIYNIFNLQWIYITIYHKAYIKSLSYFDKHNFISKILRISILFSRKIYVIKCTWCVIRDSINKILKITNHWYWETRPNGHPKLKKKLRKKLN